MPRYPVRPWCHPLTFMATMPMVYPVVLFTFWTLLIFPFRYKIARFYERQQDIASQAIKGKAVRVYRELERFHRREMTTPKNPLFDENMSTRMSLPMTMNSIATGKTDSELMYWESHQRDVMRMRKLQQEIEDLKARGAA